MFGRGLATLRNLRMPLSSNTAVCFDHKKQHLPRVGTKNVLQTASKSPGGIILGPESQLCQRHFFSITLVLDTDPGNFCARYW